MGQFFPHGVVTGDGEEIRKMEGGGVANTDLVNAADPPPVCRASPSETSSNKPLAFPERAAPISGQSSQIALRADRVSAGFIIFANLPNIFCKPQELDLKTCWLEHAPIFLQT